MSNIAASVSNETRDRSAPQAEKPSMDPRTQENTPIQDHQSSSVQYPGTSGSNNNPIRAKSIGNYILGKTLGEGTFGKVKLATHILTGEKVAIKILEKDRIIDVADVERVAREIYILKFIRHPNIIQLYEIIETPKQLFLVMEYVNGGELFDYIVSKTRVEEREASKFFHQIIAGIEYIHKLKIVHRDLKPENLLLDSNNNIKIVDFGLSNTYNENELLKTACGSPCYAAPEMIGGKKYNGLQVDIWSCGVILFAIVCGYLPFEDPNTNVLYTKIKNGDYVIPDFISDDGRDLLKNILNTDPAKRYTIDEIRKHPWMNKVDVAKKEGIIVGYHQTPVDMDILKQLDQYGFQFDYVQKCLDANKHNHVTTTYYLLLRKFYQNGGQSIADINSDTFDKSLLMPKAAQPKINNYYSVGHDLDGEKENEHERRGERDRSRKRSTDQTQGFLYGEMNIKQRQSKEIAKIYGSLLDSSSRERVPTSNYSSKGSRVLKESTQLDNSNDYKRRSLTGKKPFSPARINAKDEKPFKANDPQDSFTPSQTSNAPKNPLLNKSFNNSTLKERLKEIYRMGGDKKSKQSRGDSCDESHNGAYQSFNHELLNDSFKVDTKEVNNSVIYPLQPKLRRNSVKNTKKAAHSIQSTPKKGSRNSHQFDDKVNPGLPIDPKANPVLRVVNSGIVYNEKSRTHSQSPSKINPMQPKEPVYSKPRDSSANPYRSRAQSRKNSRPAIQMAANGKAWRPSTNQAQSRERGKSIGLGDESFKVSSNHEMSFHVGSGSFMLNNSFQKNMLDRSFDYNSHQPKAYSINLNKRMSYGEGDQNKRGRSNNISPSSVQKKKLQSLLNKSGIVKP